MHDIKSEITGYKRTFEYVHSLHESRHQMYDVYAYSYHLSMVALELIKVGLPQDHPIVLAALAHDTLEDTGITYNDLVKALGVEVADIVYDVTNELGKNRKERALKTYPKIASNPKATLVKLADRIMNTRYSKETGSSMYAKYKKEFPEFKRYLYFSSYFNDYPEMVHLWSILEKL